MCSIVEEGLIPGSAMEVEQVPNVDSVQMLIQPDNSTAYKCQWTCNKVFT